MATLKYDEHEIDDNEEVVVMARKKDTKRMSKKIESVEQNPDPIQPTIINNYHNTVDKSDENDDNSLWAAVILGIIAVEQVLQTDWWQEKASPWLKTKYQSVTNSFLQKKQKKEAKDFFDNLMTKFENEMDQCFGNITEDEIIDNLTELIGKAINISNKYYNKGCQYIENLEEQEDIIQTRKNNFKCYFTEETKNMLDKYLCGIHKQLPDPTLNEIFLMFNGGIYRNKEYVPINPDNLYDKIQLQFYN